MTNYYFPIIYIVPLIGIDGHKAIYSTGNTSQKKSPIPRKSR